MSLGGKVNDDKRVLMARSVGVGGDTVFQLTLLQHADDKSIASAIVLLSGFNFLLI